MQQSDKICAFGPNVSKQLDLGSEDIRQINFAAANAQELHELKTCTRAVIIVDADELAQKQETYLDILSEVHPFGTKFIVLCSDKKTRKDFAHLSTELLYLILPQNIEEATLVDSIHNAFHTLKLETDAVTLQSQLELSYQDVHTLTKVGQALAVEHDFDRLIELIITEARRLTSADGGSIYLVEQEGHEKPTHLRFKKSALNLNAEEFLLPLNKHSIAGWVAHEGRHLIIDDAYALSGEEDYHFNPDFDKHHNYYTKSIMTIPMKNHKDQVIGVIQLINRKKNFNKTLTAEEMKTNEVLPFDAKSYELGMSLAGQAAVAIQNNRLIKDINNLFEGFVMASVTAIEQRDPTTSGHSFRVAQFSINLAEALDRAPDGQFRDIKFSRDQLRELRYASLLHDFGKVGVREKVLVKPKKLYEHELDSIEWRFRYIQKQLENEYLKKKIKLLQSKNSNLNEELEHLDRKYIRKKAEIHNMLDIIRDANEPSILEEGNFKILQDITKHKVKLDDGDVIPFLKENELFSLSVRKGSLNQEERVEIESHVTHTYQFLIQIPWTSDLKNVPDIAYKHHEKLDGSGYPLKVEAQEISVQSRMMTISDIYDALTAWDRPYKKAISTERALDILHEEAKNQHIDVNLLNVFIETESYKIDQSAYNVAN